MSDLAAVLHKERHVRYWLRCAKTFLPNQYTSNDANRMLLAFFIVGALDLLDVLDSKVSAEERSGWIDWLYSCQTAEGGFRGFTGTDLGNLRDEANRHWDPANVPATFFALFTLVMLGDDLERVNRLGCMRWLQKLQRSDGSFGETLGEGGSIEGGSDLRFCCCAAGIRYLLKDPGSPKVVRFDEAKLVEYIKSCQTFEGGFSEGIAREAHSGLTYCAIGALVLLEKDVSTVLEPGKAADLLRWLLQRQTIYIEDDNEEEEEQSNGDGDGLYETSSHSEQIFDFQSAPLDVVGMNGRTNKMADTCYCWWNIGTLSMLGQTDMVKWDGLRQYLLTKVQHGIGGFGKGVGEPPDILHSYLGLASLALMGESGLKAVSAEFCIGQEAVKRVTLLKTG